LIVFDLVTIAVFLVTASVDAAWWIIPLDLALAAILILEFAARAYASNNPRRQIFSFASAVDIVVILSLMLPAFVENLGFLRVVRALRVLRSYHLMRDLRQDSPWFRAREDVVLRTLNLFVFIFIVTSVVYVTQHNHNPQIATYLDALYFTVTTLTTTGFGDVTLQGAGGRLIAIVIMVIGVSLFLRLLQAVFRPFKVRQECEACGLLVHDIDAVHCKHCGRLMHIRDEGAV
jgi:voltage-gated potassium channel